MSMGLDMFLMLDKGRKGTAEIERIWGSEEYWSKVAKLKDGEFDGLKLAQWRKAFGILNWFDHNLESVAVVNKDIPEEKLHRDGVQYDQYYLVKKDEIERLLALCHEMLALAGDGFDETEVPEDIRPIGKGYFIGATDEINDWWWEDLDTTIYMLQDIDENIDWNEDDAYFCIG